MKKDIVTYKFGSFVNYEGVSQKVIVCAVSKSPCCDEDYIVRELYLGLSICNPNDTYDEELGKKIAYSKAVNIDPVLFATFPGIINSSTVDNILNSELEFIKKHPGKYIAGYDEKAKKHFDYDLAMSMFNEMTPEEQKIVKMIQENKFDVDAYNFVAKATK